MVEPVIAKEEDLPTIPNLSFYLLTHDVYTTDACTLEENRFKVKDFIDQETNSIKDLYCWKGIIRTDPDCAIGSVCDEHSYTGARSRFCKTWGCIPSQYVSNEGTEDGGLPVYNERGGINVYAVKGDCEGAFVNKIKCIMSGLRQSLDNAMAPENKTRFVVYMVASFIIALVSAIAFRSLPQRTRNEVINNIKPKKSIL